MNLKFFILFLSLFPSFTRAQEIILPYLAQEPILYHISDFIQDKSEGILGCENNHPLAKELLLCESLIQNKEITIPLEDLSIKKNISKYTFYESYKTTGIKVSIFTTKKSYFIKFIPLPLISQKLKSEIFLTEKEDSWFCSHSLEEKPIEQFFLLENIIEYNSPSIKKTSLFRYKNASCVAFFYDGLFFQKKEFFIPFTQSIENKYIQDSYIQEKIETSFQEESFEIIQTPPQNQECFEESLSSIHKALLLEGFYVTYQKCLQKKIRYMSLHRKPDIQEIIIQKKEDQGECSFKIKEKDFDHISAEVLIHSHLNTYSFLASYLSSLQHEVQKEFILYTGSIFFPRSQSQYAHCSLKVSDGILYDFKSTFYKIF